jgi:membrane fusion protein
MASLFYSALMVALVIVGMCVPYTRKVTVPGVLVPGDGFVELFSKRSGVISHVLVSEGQVVNKGQLIAKVSVDTTLDAETTLADLQERASTSRVEASHLNLEADRRAMLQKRADLKARMIAAERQQAILDQQSAYASERVKIAKERVAAVTGLVDKGFASKIQLQQWKAAVIDAELAQLDVDQRLADLAKSSEQRRVEGLALDAEVLRNSAAAASADASTLEEKASVAQQREQLVVATRSGRVTALRAYAGAKISSGAPIAMIAPSSEPLRATFQAPSRAVGRMRVGDKVNLMFDAFPYQTFGLGHGEVARIASSPLGEGAAANDGGFLVDVKLSSTSVTGQGRQWSLLPGMKVVGVFELERRSLLAWILDPFFALRARPL